MSGSLAAVGVPNICQLVGTRGCLSSVDRSDLTVVTHEGFGDDKEPINKEVGTYQVGGGMNEALDHLYEDFANAIRDGRDPRVTLEQAMMATAISQYAADSAARGERVRIDLG